MSQKKTGYIWHELYGWHDTGTHTSHFQSGGYNQPYKHIESPESKTRMASLIEVSGLINELDRIPARYAKEEDILRVHTADYVRKIQDLSKKSGGDAGDGSTHFGYTGYETACLAAGGVIAATEAVLTQRVRNAYALVRPPGHHARPEMGMGFCIFANVCIAIEYIRKHHGTKRVAIVDYDVHHGNGAQHIYWDDPNVLTISIHQDYLYPVDTGGIEEVGGDKAKGSCINIPLPAGAGNGAYYAAIDDVVAPAIENFKPEIIMVSSGFDASAMDPLGRMMVTVEGYKKITNQLVAIAEKVCNGKIVFAHEGGYSPTYVPFCGLAVLEALSGIDTDVKDPFITDYATSPAHKVTGAQREVIEQAAALARALRLE